jgi:hypothetical protein
MFEGTKAGFAIQSTQGGILRARRLHGMHEPPQAYNTLFSGQKHTCTHIMKNQKCSSFEATAKVAAMLYWAVKRASDNTNTPELMDLAQDFKDSVIMALSKDGEAGAGSRNGVWQPTTIADEIIEEMEFSYQETCSEITKMLSQRIDHAHTKPTSSIAGSNSTNPYAAALRLAAEQNDWDQSDLEFHQADLPSWTEAAIDELITAFAFETDDFDHFPWELSPLLQAGIHIARHKMVKQLMDEMRQDEALFESLNVINLMMLETSELASASKYLEITEALYDVLGLEWQEEVKGNAHYFAANLEKVGFTEEYIREHMIREASSS